MKKRLLSLLCALALAFTLLPGVSALEGDDLRTAQTLSSLGLVSRVSSAADYQVTNIATQEQAAALLVRMLGAQQDAAQAGSCGWNGVPAWAQSAVNYCAGKGLILPTEYRSRGLLTADLWCSMLLRALGYREESGDFTAASAATTAQRLGLIPHALSNKITRGEMFEAALCALRYSGKDGTTLLDSLVSRGLCAEDTVSALGLRDERLTARQAADRYLSSVLCLRFYDSDEAVKNHEPTSNASAFLISADGLAVTNCHSLEEVVAGTATLSTGETVDIERVIYYDDAIDIAVLRLSRTTLDGTVIPAFHPIELAGTREVRAGDTVYAIGNPLGLGLAVSQGIVGSTSHIADLSSLPCLLSDATISRGSSGGVLLNEYGHAIAVTSGAYTYGNNMYLSVPVEPVMRADLTGEGETVAQASAAIAAAAAQAAQAEGN